MNLKSFKINKLYGYRDVHIDFDSSVKILIGENGLGKTTVLNIIYYTLSKNFEKLDKINFHSIEIHFANKKKIHFTKDILQKHLLIDRENTGSHFNELLSNISSGKLKQLREVIYDGKNPTQHRRIELQNLLRQEVGLNINAPAVYIFDMIKKYFDEIDANSFYETIKELDDAVDSKILYFPTYRRIEEDIKNITSNHKNEESEYKKARFKKMLFENGEHEDIIQFGMQDVEQRIDRITSEIAHSSMLGFSDITAEMLHQLLTDFPNVKNKKRNKNDFDKLNIMLDRIGQKLSNDDRLKIDDYINNGYSDNKGLIFFINKLIDLYNKLEDQDIAIKQFINVCNYYFLDKKYVYNDREVVLNIQHLDSKYKSQNRTNVIDLNKLSSGEKQIVSLFSKIYLEENERFIVLFDEPELSLSIYWQQRLLPDIVNSKKCDLLLAVTHSPFIYENELFDQTTVLKDYIKQ